MPERRRRVVVPAAGAGVGAPVLRCLMLVPAGVGVSNGRVMRNVEPPVTMNATSTACG